MSQTSLYAAENLPKHVHKYGTSVNWGAKTTSLTDLNVDFNLRGNTIWSGTVGQCYKPVVGYAEKAEPRTFATPSPKSCETLT